MSRVTNLLGSDYLAYLLNGPRDNSFTEMNLGREGDLGSDGDRALKKKEHDCSDEFDFYWRDSFHFVEPDTPIRDITGSNNNPYVSEAGQAHQVFMSNIDSNDLYGDGISTPSGADRPNAREISNEIFDQTQDLPSTIGASNFLWMWGQFLDHDINLTLGGTERFDIDVPIGDPDFDPMNTGAMKIHLTRSDHAPGTGEGTSTPAQQINGITAFIDASNVYGSDPIREAALRDVGGKLKVSADDMLPLNTDGLENANDTHIFSDEEMYLAGDVRANENAALTSLHTLFVREHNRLVDELSQKFPSLDDDELYQHAKAIVESQMQIITYNEFLPLIIGENAIDQYSGYDSSVDPQISVEFATAAFRIGHTMLNSTIARMEEDGSTSSQNNLGLLHAFFNPYEVTDDKMNDLMRGQAATTSQAIDTFIIDDVRNFLFGPPGAGGLDLGALNIQRGRDHGLPDLNTVRESYGLDPYLSFGDLTSDAYLASQLEMVYGSIDKVDLFVGGLAEDNVPGATVGETFQLILVDQFTRLRDGDSFWYENRFSEYTIEHLEQTKLSDIILRNSDIDYIQNNVFLQSERIGGTDRKDKLIGDEDRDLIIGFKGNDLIKGKAGDDDLFGGHGRDKIYGGAGDDFIYGEKGNDLIKGNGGDDHLFGGHGRDKIFGGAGDDFICGGKGNDTINGGKGFDTVYVDANFFDVDVKHTKNGFVLTSQDEGRDRLFNVEQLKFNDCTYTKVTDDDYEIVHYDFFEI